jgi:hypothetical protein
MSHLDGINYGRDQVSSWTDPPLEFKLADWQGKTVLTSHAEYPQARIQKSDIPDTVEINEPSLIKKLTTPFSKREGFMAIAGAQVDLTLLELIVLLVLVLMFALNLGFHVRRPIILFASALGPSEKPPLTNVSPIVAPVGQVA